MPSILIVEKNGNVKPLAAKSLTVTDLYKKAGFKSADGFKQHINWKLNIDDTDYNVCLYGKTDGRANNENKYDFPPPVDSTLFFGNCVLINIINGEIRDLNVDDWETIYEYLFGGFEDLGDDDSEEESDDDDGEYETTKDGYAKDGFVVDDDEEDVYSDESEEYKPKRKSKNTKSKNTKSKNTDILECESELSEEDYV
jgi:hypothetical protein